MNLTSQLTGAGVIPWSPLARGFLTKPVKAQATTARSEKDPHLAYMTEGAAEASNAINVAYVALSRLR